MIVAAEYSFNRGNTIRETRSRLIQELEDIIDAVDASRCRVKTSREITMPGRTLYSPVELNSNFASGFKSRGWTKQRVKCDYPTHYYRAGYNPKQMRGGAFREMDFLKDGLGVEIQFGKYAHCTRQNCRESSPTKFC